MYGASLKNHTVDKKNILYKYVIKISLPPKTCAGKVVSEVRTCRPTSYVSLDTDLLESVHVHVHVSAT